MKYYEYKIDSDKIEFLNSFLGKETVKLNGEKVSEKYSIKGTEHFFNIGSDQILLQTKYKLFKDRKFELKLFKKRELLDSKRIELDKKNRLILIGIGVLLGFGFFELYYLI